MYGPRQHASGSTTHELSQQLQIKHCLHAVSQPQHPWQQRGLAQHPQQQRPGSFHSKFVLLPARQQSTSAHTPQQPRSQHSGRQSQSTQP